MKRKIHLKKYRRYNKKDIIYYFFLGLIISFLLVIELGVKLNKALMIYAVEEAKKFTTVIINKSISDDVIDTLDIDNLFVIVKNDEGEIQTIDFNTAMVNKVLKYILTMIETNIANIEDGKLQDFDLSDSITNSDLNKLKKGIICELPIGVLTNNSLLANLGPKMPVRLALMGHVTGNINSSIKSYGINNVLLEVNVVLTVTQNVMMPLFAKPIVVEEKIPLAIKIIPGKVPTYYQNGIDKNSAIFSLPIQ